MSEQNSGEQPPRPRYGEYAPPGWTPPQQEQPAAPPAPPAAPAWTGTPTQPAPPTYSPGSYNPSGWGETSAPAAPKRRVWDLVLTIVFLVIGLFGAGYGVLVGIGTASPALLNDQLKSIYGGDPHIEAGSWPIVIVVCHVVLYLAAIGLSIVSLLRRRVTFWIPLVAGVAAFLFFVIGLVAIVMSDPAYVEQIGSR